MWFLFVRPEICPQVSMFPTSSFLQIPPHDRHPCLRLYPSHYRADSGLAPVGNVRRRAHDSKQRLPALPETAVSACWGSTPNPLNSPVAGAGCAFVSRTLLSLRCRKGGACAPWRAGEAADTALPEKEKTRLACTSARYRIAARLARDCLDNSQISSRRFCKSSMSAA